MAISNSEDDDTATMRGERKRKRGDADRRLPPSRWRKESFEKTYSSKLLEALGRLRAGPRRSRAVQGAADRALAAAARGRTRWSRAILSRRAVELDAVRRRRRGGRRRAAGPQRPPPERRRRREEAVRRKAEMLGQLVPGCRKVSLPTLLEETSDYIAALEMQVRAMSAISEALSTAGGSAPAPPDRPVSSSTT